MKKSVKGHDEKNQLSQVKELWLFWYGEKPESVTKLCSPDLREVEDSSPGTGPGSWESGIPYEARTLLFKAVNNLIERSLLSKHFVRLGKWFVQPYDGADRSLHKGSHLSFSFQYFVHGESAVCTSVDVRQHPPVRRLAHQHLATAAGASASVQVLLAPYGMAGTLTGQHFGPTEPAVRRYGSGIVVMVIVVVIIIVTIIVLIIIVMVIIIIVIIIIFKIIIVIIIIVIVTIIIVTIVIITIALSI